MTEAEAKAWEGKRVRTLDSSHEVPQGTEGAMIDAAPGGSIGEVASFGRGTPTLTDEGWFVDMKPDDPRYSPSQCGSATVPWRRYEH